MVFLIQYLLIDKGFTTSRSDSSLFLCNHNGIRTFILIYMDDIVITGSNTNFIHKLIANLGLEFALKDLGHCLSSLA